MEQSRLGILGWLPHARAQKNLNIKKWSFGSVRTPPKKRSTEIARRSRMWKCSRSLLPRISPFLRKQEMLSKKKSIRNHFVTLRNSSTQIFMEISKSRCVSQHEVLCSTVSVHLWISMRFFTSATRPTMPEESTKGVTPNVYPKVTMLLTIDV